MKTFAVLLLSLVCASAQVVLSGKVTTSGNVKASAPLPQPPGASVVFSDFHYSSNFDSNNTTRTVAPTPPNATITAGWTNAIGSLALTGGDVTYDVYFKLDGTSALCTNFGANIATEGDYDHTYALYVTINGWSDGYETGTEFFNLSVPLVWSYNPCDGNFIEVNLGNTAISPPQDIVYVHMSYRLVAPTGAFHLRDFNFILNE